MHNRIKDVKSGSDDNGGIVEVKDKICFDGIDIGKYANFRTLFNTLKKRNASSTDADHTHHLVSSQQERSGCRSVSVAEDCTPSIPFQQLNVTSENSNDERIVENCQASDELQPGTCSTVMIPTNFVRKKLQLHVNKQICCKEMATLNATSKTREIPSATFDLLLDCSKKEIQIDKDEGNKIVNDTAPLVRPHPFKNGTARSVETTLASSEIQMPSSSLLFRRTFEFLTREKEGIGRIDKGPVGRSLSFDDAYTVTKGKCLVRNTGLDIKPLVVQEMEEKTLVHIDGERTDPNLRRTAESDNSSSKLVSKKEVCFNEGVESHINADKLQEISTLRNINKILARKLAKTERIAQLLQIQLKFYDKTNDAKFACRLADIIDRLKLLLPNDQFRDKALQVLNSVNPSIGVNDEKSVFLDNLLKEIEYDKRKCCEKLVEYVRKHPPLLMELQNQANEMRDNVEHEMMMKTTPNGNIIDGSCENHQCQITSLEANLMLHREQLAMKDVQLRKLEEEIGNAHRCNQQLNAKLGSMVATNGINFLNQEKELKKALRERTSECDSLKKKIEKFERDRQQWENQKRMLEARQPMDVQILQGQKRELTMQLDREQAEKQELFMQINSLIAQLADTNRDGLVHQEYNVLKDENEKLKEEIANILDTQSQLNADVRNLQEEVRCKNQEVESAQDESRRLRLIMNNEKVQLESSIEELQRDLQMKSAALQSLMLAKQDVKTNEADSAMITRLTVENEEMRGQLDEIKSEVKKRVFEIEEMKLANEKKLRTLQTELESVRETVKEKEAELSKQADEIKRLQSELNSELENVQKKEADLSLMRNKENEILQLQETLAKYKLDGQKIIEQLKESEKNLIEYKEKYETLEKDSEARFAQETDAFASAKKKFEEEIRLQEQTLKMERMQKQEAELELKSYRSKIADLEEELKNLRIQSDKRRGFDEQMQVLREELKQAKCKIAAQAADLEKAEADADEAERSSRETIDELEEEIRSLQEKLKILEINEEKQNKRLLMAEEEIKRNQETSEKYEKKCETLTKELEEVHCALADTRVVLEKSKAENEKLLAKASLEDEVLTLATSLQSARDEISVKHDEIVKIRKELREVREENERLLMDVNVQTQDAQLAWSERDEMKKEMEKWKSDNTVQQQEYSLALVQLKDEISKLEKQIIEKGEMFSSLQSDMKSKHQKTLIEAKQQYEQQIAELNREVEKLRASEGEKIEELSAVKTNLRKELAMKGGSVVPFRIDQHHEFQNKTQNVDLSPRSDFEEKLATLKECIADVLEEKFLFDHGDCQPEMVNRTTQTRIEMEKGKHIISVNNDDEETVGPTDRNIPLVKQEIDSFDQASRSCGSISEEQCRLRPSSEVWSLRAELAFLKKQIKEDEIDRKCLQKHIHVLQTTIQENKEILDLIKETEKNIKSDKLETQKRLDPFVEQIEMLKTELANVEKYREQYKREIEERDLNIASLKKEIENLTSGIKSCKAHLQKNGRLEERNRMIELENKNLLDECSSLKSKLAELKKQIMKVESENIRKHAEEINDLNEQLNKARQAYELSGVEMDRLREQCENLSNEVNQLRNFLNIANTEKEQLRTEALQQLNEMQRLSCEQAKLEVTRQQLDEAKAEGERQAQELARLKIQAKSDEVLEKNRQHELRCLRQQIQTIEEKWKMECKKSETDAQVAKDEFKKLTKINETLNKNIERLTNELEVERKQIIDLDMEKIHLLSEIKQLRNELDTSKTVSALLERESPEAERQEQNREELGKLTQLNDQVEKLKREVKWMKDENDELRSENERIKKELDEMQREMKENKQTSQQPGIEDRLKESESSLTRLEVLRSTPAPPPRRRIEGEITDGVLEVSLTEENKKLKKDVEMQHRLIVVLRRKLQSMQHEQQQ